MTDLKKGFSELEQLKELLTKQDVDFDQKLKITGDGLLLIQQLKKALTISKENAEKLNVKICDPSGKFQPYE